MKEESQKGRKSVFSPPCTAAWNPSCPLTASPHPRISPLSDLAPCLSEGYAENLDLHHSTAVSSSTNQPAGLRRLHAGQPVSSHRGSRAKTLVHRISCEARCLGNQGGATFKRKENSNNNRSQKGYKSFIISSKPKQHLAKPPLPVNTTYLQVTHFYYLLLACSALCSRPGNRCSTGNEKKEFS